MSKLVFWIQTFLLPALGPVGLFLVAFLDASFLSLPEINDILVVTAAARPPHSIVVPVFSATLGSLVGSAILWWLGHRGADSELLRKYGTRRLEKAKWAFRRWGGLALFFPALAPPPVPFKVFVLAAGASGYPFRRFVVAVTAGRAVRYVFWAVLGVAFGEKALALLETADSWTIANSRSVLIGVTTLVLALVVCWLGVRGRRPAPNREDPVV